MNYLRRCLFDIEVRSPNEFPKPENAKFPISALTLWDSFTNHYYTLSYHSSCQIEKITKDANWDVYHFNQEILLPINFIKLIRALDPDTFEGFFSRTFDFPYIFNRLTNLNLSPNSLSTTGYVSLRNGKLQIDGRHVLDIVDMDKKFKKRPSYSLANIAAEEQLKTKKIEVDIRTVHDDLSKLDEYNKVDVEVPLELDKKMQHLRRYTSRWQFSGLEEIEKAMSNSVVVDTVMLREARKLGIVLPSKPEYAEKDKDEEDDDITGGLVLPPVIGIHDWVDVFDMSRFYPNLALLICMSPENISPDGTLVSANGTRFLNNPNAFLPRIISMFFAERDKVQVEKSKLTPDQPEYWKLHEEDENIKFLVNSIPGVFGSKSFRLYDPRILDSITTSGQVMILKSKEYAESKGKQVIYGDTDSAHAKMDVNNLEDALKSGQQLSSELNPMFPLWAKELFNVDNGSSIKIVFEKVYRRIVYIPKDDGTPAKKRYFARLVYEKGKPTDQVFIRGLDYRRSDTAKVSKNLQYDVVKMILYADDLEAVKSELIAYVKNIIKSYESVPLSDIGIPFGFTKSLEQYGGVDKNGRRRGLDPEVRGALYSNEHFHTNFGAESKVKLLYINSITGYPRTDCICFEDEKLLPKLEVNYKKMIDATIKKKVERILLVCGIGWNEIESGRKSLFGDK